MCLRKVSQLTKNIYCKFDLTIQKDISTDEKQKSHIQA